MPIIQFSFSGRFVQKPTGEYKNRRVQVDTHVSDIRHAEQVFEDFCALSGLEKEPGTDVKAKFIPGVVA